MHHRQRINADRWTLPGLQMGSLIRCGKILFAFLEDVLELGAVVVTDHADDLALA